MRYTSLSYKEAVEKELRVMDAAAISICRDNKIPIKVFSVDSLKEGMTQKECGTLIT